jgi:hypothetical protein
MKFAMALHSLYHRSILHKLYPQAVNDSLYVENGFPIAEIDDSTKLAAVSLINLQFYLFSRVCSLVLKFSSEQSLRLDLVKTSHLTDKCVYLLQEPSFNYTAFLRV